MKRQSIALTAFLLTPVAAIFILVWAIIVSLRTGPEMRAPRVGAGAGDTGGANAFADLIAGRKSHPESERPPDPPDAVRPESLAQGFDIVVHDATGRADEKSPVYVAGNFNDWNPGDPKAVMTRRADGAWTIRLTMPPVPPGERMEFRLTRGGWDTAEVRGDLSEVRNRALPGAAQEAVRDGQSPVFEFTVERWADQRGKR